PRRRRPAAPAPGAPSTCAPGGTRCRARTTGRSPPARCTPRSSAGRRSSGTSAGRACLRLAPPGDLEAGVDPRVRAPGHVDGVDPPGAHHLGGAPAPGPGGADDVDRAVGGQVVEAVGHRGQRDQHGPRHVGGDVLVGLAHVDERRAVAPQPGELGDVDLRHLHGGAGYRLAGAGPSPGPGGRPGRAPGGSAPGTSASATTAGSRGSSATRRPAAVTPACTARSPEANARASAGPARARHAACSHWRRPAATGTARPAPDGVTSAATVAARASTDGATRS